MSFIGIFASLMLAQAQPATQPDPRGQAMTTFGMMALMAVIMYVLMIRPQQKKAKDHAALLKTLKSGDKVVTSGGILGVVISVKDKSVTLRSGDTKMEVLKSAVSEVTERSGAAAAAATPV